MLLIARRFFLLALVAACACAARVGAQTAVDVGAAQSIRQGMESGQLREDRRQPPARQQDAAESQESADEEGAASTPQRDERAGVPGAMDPASGHPLTGVLVEDVTRSRKPGEQDKWGDTHAFFRQPGPSIALAKLLPVLFVFFCWIYFCDWANRASQRYQLGYMLWSAITVFSGLVGLLLVLLVPFFMVTFPLYCLSVLGPFIAFSIVHNRSVEQHQKVFTGEWWRYTFATMAGRVGIKVDTERKADYMKGPPVDLIAMGAKEEHGNEANLLTARQSPGYVLVKELIADMVTQNSERVLLDYTPESVGVRHNIDGVWENGEARDRESGDVMLAVMKQLANLDLTERRKRQEGEFAAKYEDVEYECPILTQGVKTGERVMVSVVNKGKASLNTFAQLGMREKLAEQWADVMLRDSGLVIVSAMPQGGLTTLTDVVLLETDRLMRDFVSIEEKSDPHREIENIEPNYYDASAGQTPATLMPKLVRKYPNVYVARDLVDEESAKALLDQANADRLVVTTTRAKDATEAILRVMQDKAPKKLLAECVIASLNTRLIRVLCSECKVGYEPSPDLLKKLGIPQGKVELLYRVPNAEEAPKPCPKCHGRGYYGRTGLFELLEVDDRVREALLKQPKPEVVRKAARNAGMRTLQEEGILLIAKGATSLQELQRVLKQ